jgi:hypothetical protein
VSIQSDLDRGTRAERLLNDPMLTEAFESVKAAILLAWASAPMRDREGAHELKLMLKLLSDVRSALEVALADGKIAAAELQRQNEKLLTPAQFSREYR